MNKSTDQIDVLIRARLPIVWTVSYEEARVEKAVCAIVKRNNSEFGTTTKTMLWSVTSGLRSHDGKEVVPDCEAPLAVLERILSHGEDSVFILRDFGHFLNTGNSYLVQRTLRDVVAEITTSGLGTSIIILDSQLQVPDRVEKDISVVDFDLPTEEELAAHLLPMALDCENIAAMPEEERDALMYTGVRCSRGLTLTEAENVLAKSLAEVGTISPSIITGEKKHIIRRAGVLEFFDTDRAMRDVGGLDMLKVWLRNRSRAYSKEARAYGLPSPKGILLVGIPGTGKSLVAKCVGREWNMPVLRMDVGALFGSYVGESEANMRKALKTAEALSPCVLWIN